MSAPKRQLLLKYFVKLRDGIDQQPPAFDEQASSIPKQDRIMNHPQASGAVQGAASDTTGITTNTGPSLQRASILFVASVGSFIGASLWLASIRQSGEPSFPGREHELFSV